MVYIPVSMVASLQVFETSLEPFLFHFLEGRERKKEMEEVEMNNQIVKLSSCEEN